MGSSSHVQGCGHAATGGHTCHAAGPWAAPSQGLCVRGGKMGGPNGAGTRRGQHRPPSRARPQTQLGDPCARAALSCPPAPGVAALLWPLCCPPWPVCIWSVVSHLVGKGPCSTVPNWGAGGRWGTDDQAPAQAGRAGWVSSPYFTNRDGGLRRQGRRPPGTGRWLRCCRRVQPSPALTGRASWREATPSPSPATQDATGQ